METGPISLLLPPATLGTKPNTLALTRPSRRQLLPLLNILPQKQAVIARFLGRAFPETSVSSACLELGITFAVPI